MPPRAKADPWGGRGPRWLTHVDPKDIARGDGEDFQKFIETVCRITKDSVAGPSGELLRLRPWQGSGGLTGHLFAKRADGLYKHRQALIGVPRKNGKSGIGSGWALGALVLGPQGGEVYACAGDKDQARIVFGDAKRMVEMDQDLSAILKPYKDAIECPMTGSVFRVLSAEAFTKEGKSPTFTLFDEVHVQPNRELWDVMALAQGARKSPLMVGITTAGVRFDSYGNDTLCYTMYEHGKRIVAGEVDDPSFFFAWWEPSNPQADHRNPQTWEEANPGYDDIVAAEDFASAVTRTPESEFRIKRTNQWVASATTWLPTGAWEERKSDRTIEPGTDVVLGFDGSHSNDSTALVVVTIPTYGPAAEGANEAQRTIETPSHVEIVELWEKDADDKEWRVPIADVENKIREACRKWNVLEIVCDPARWARTYQELEAERLPVVEFPQSPQRMVPATQRLYEAVLNGGVTHNGDARLARHLANAVVKNNGRGAMIFKETKGSPRKIDAAVALVIAFERAAVAEPPVQDYFFSWDEL